MTNIEKRTVTVDTPSQTRQLDLFGVYAPNGVVLAAFETYAEALAYSDQLAHGDED